MGSGVRDQVSYYVLDIDGTELRRNPERNSSDTGCELNVHFDQCEIDSWAGIMVVGEYCDPASDGHVHDAVAASSCDLGAAKKTLRRRSQVEGQSRSRTGCCDLGSPIDALLHSLFVFCFLRSNDVPCHT